MWEVPKGALAGIPMVGASPWGITRFVYVPATRAVLGYSNRECSGSIPTIASFPSTPGFHQFTLAAPLKVTGRDSVWHAIDRDLVLNGRRVYTLDPGPNQPTGRITDVLFDREGGIWLATDGMGLHRLRRSLFTTYSTPEGLAARNAYVVTRDSSDAIWVGGLTEGSSRISPDRRTIQNFPPARGFPAQVTSILVDGDRYLISTAFGILSCSAEACAAPGLPRSIFPACTRSTGHGTEECSPAPRARSSRAGRHAGSRCRNGPARARPAPLPKPLMARSGSAPTAAAWCAAFPDAAARLTTAEGLPADLVRSLYVDGDGWLWIGTEGRGLARLDPAQLARRG